MSKQRYGFFVFEKLQRFRTTYETMFSARMLVLSVLACLIAIVAGPFGTFSSMTLGVRILYWGLAVPGSIALGYTGYALARTCVDPEQQFRIILWGSSIGTLLITGGVLANNAVVAAISTFQAPSALLVFSYVALVNGAVGVLRFLLLRHEESVAEALLENSTDERSALPRLARRLPPDVQGNILHLSVNDHFVKVLTDAGTTDIRMRFRDALDELDGVNGYRVHRSHWVAHSAVQGIEKDRARVFVNLPQGHRVPVSRNYHGALEDAGWL